MFTPFPRDAIERSIPDRFAAMVARHPERVAVRFRDDAITYAALRRRSLAVAARLRAERPAPGAVAVLLPQGIPLIAAILGVLEAGDWYVPLDPGATPEALLEALAHAQAAIAIAGAGTPAAATAKAVARVVPIEDVDPDAGAGTARPPLRPDALAYVYFTSGTTGRRKGVMDCHRNVLHNVMRYTNTLRLSDDDRMTLLQASTFSGAVSSTFGALLNGATLLPYDVAADGIGPPLARWLAAAGPTVYHSVPTLFRSVCAGDAVFPTVRIVRLEGDSAAPGDVALLRRHFAPTCILVNGLGTTETGICRQHFVRPGDPPPDRVLPVGHAVEDMDVRVLDPSGRPVPAGVVGEIVVRSRYLSPGYWRDPERTALAFRADPDDPERRAYRTGDAGRLLDDGSLEHLGRVGDQVKVHGEWVDVPAIEAAIGAIAGVRETAVAAVPREDGEKVLTAWVVPTADPPPPLAALRRALAARLPAHMIPTRAFALAALPLGPSGKLDRAALPGSGGTPLPPDAGAVPPRTPIEESLAAIWRDVLGVSGFGVHDAFTELGGDSLAAASVWFEIDRRLGRSLPPGILLGADTIAKLAEAVARAPAAAPGGALIAIQPHGSEPPLFCVHDPDSDAFLFARLAHHLGPAQPVHALRFHAGVDGASLPRTIAELADRYVSELRAIAPSGPYRLAGFCFGAVVALEMAHRLRAANQDVALLALVNVTAFDFPDLVTPAALRRFRLDWGARLRYLLRKPDRVAWVRRRLGATLADAAWRLASAWPGRTGATPPPEALVRSVLLDAFRRHHSRPWPGTALLFPAEESLPLYADDPAEAWAPLARTLEIHPLPRDGYAMLVEPDVRLLADRLRPRLADPARIAGAATGAGSPG